ARLPLALVIAAAHRGSAPGPVDRPVAALVDRLRRGRTALDVLTGDEARSDLRAVFDCSYQALSPPAARLFRLLGLHPGPDISTAAAASLAGLHPDRARPLLGELTRKGTGTTTPRSNSPPCRPPDGWGTPPHRATPTANSPAPTFSCAGTTTSAPTWRTPSTCTAGPAT